MEISVFKAQVLSRLFSVLVLVCTACVVGFDAQTKRFLSVFEKRATVKDLNSLVVLTIVESVAASYNLFHLINDLIFARSGGKEISFNGKLAWLYFIFDQVMAYLSFATNTAITQAAFLAISGANEFQWLKMCSTYTRFCIQIAGGIVCGFAATLAMILISFISAFNLFRFYSSTKFLAVKQYEKRCSSFY